MKKTILIIEDEKNIIELIKYNLEKEGWKVISALKGPDGLEKVRAEKPDLIILDLMLPELNGLEICKILKQDHRTALIPVIMLTAKGEEADKVIGLELGADDYITKPFSPRELVARVKAVLRRCEEKTSEMIFRCGALVLDPVRHVVSLKGNPVPMTSKEYDLLLALMNAHGRVLSREYLLEKVWGYDKAVHIETRTVDMHIGQIRKKIDAEADRIVTVKNVGYRFDDES